MITDNLKKQIHELRRSGCGYKRIARELGMSVDSVKSFCRNNGLVGDVTISNVCRECGKALVQREKKKRVSFCSAECRNAWWQRNRDKAARKSKVTVDCAGCGKTFLAYARENRKYCCHDCYITNRFKGGECDV